MARWFGTTYATAGSARRASSWAAVSLAEKPFSAVEYRCSTFAPRFVARVRAVPARDAAAVPGAPLRTTM
nr:hypothetical protein [Phytohabitans rumicis]